MDKEQIALSIIKIQDGHIELGPNRPAHLVSLFFSALSGVGGILLAWSGRWGVALAFFIAAVLLELNRRWMSRWRLTVDGRQVAYTGRKGPVAPYDDDNLGAAIYQSSPESGAGFHYSTRLSFSHPDIPNILIQHPFFFLESAKKEEETALNYLETIKKALSINDGATSASHADTASLSMQR